MSKKIIAFTAALVCLALQTSCRLGSDYTVTEPTTLNSGGSGVTAAGSVSAIVLVGPTFIKVDGCRGPFTVVGHDDQGRSGAVFSGGSSVRITGLPPGTGIFSDSSCSTGAGNSGLQVPSEGSPRLEFYLTPVSLGEANLAASNGSLIEGHFKTTILAGSAREAVILSPRNISAFRCVQASIYLRDARGNRTNAEETIDFDLSLSNFPRLNFYANAGCTIATSSARALSGASETAPFYLFASGAGDGVINAAPNSATIDVAHRDVSAMVNDAPRLTFSHAAGRHAVHTCLAVTLLSQDSQGSELKMRVPTTVQLEDNSSSFQFFGQAGCTGAITSADFAAQASSVTFWASTDVGPQTVGIAAREPNYVSAVSSLQWIAGAPKTVEFFALLPTSHVGDSMPGFVKLKDAYNNYAVVSQRTPIVLAKSSNSVANVKFLAGSCQGPQSPQIHVEVNEASSPFCLLFTKPGALTIGASSAGLIPASADIMVGPYGGPASRLVFDTVATVEAGVCVPFTLKAQDAFQNPLPVGQAINFKLSSPSPTARFFSSGAPCNGAISAIVMPQGSSSVTGYWSDTKAGSTVLTTKNDPEVPLPLDASATVEILAGRPTQIVWQGIAPGAFPGQVIGPVALIAKDAFDNPARLAQALVATVSVPGAADNKFSVNDPSFNTSTTQVTIPVTENRLDRIYLRVRSIGNFDVVAHPTVSSIADASTRLEIRPAPATSLRLTVATTSPAAGDCVPATATLVDGDNNPLVLDPVSLSLSSDSPVAGVFKTASDCTRGLSPEKLNLTPAQPVGQFMVRTTLAGPLQINAILDGTTQTRSVTLNVGPGGQRHLDLESSGPNQFLMGGVGGPYEVVLRDGFGNLVKPDTNQPISLNSSPADLSILAGPTVGSGTPVLSSLTGRGNFYLTGSVPGVHTISAVSGGLTSSNRSVTVRNLTPTILAVVPGEGPTAGGTRIVLTGTEFVSGMGVMVGGAACSSVSVTNPSSLACTTPAGTAGKVDVVVSPPNGAAANMHEGFTYLAPAPTCVGIQPSEGPEAGGTPVTVMGSGFIAGASVTFDGLACASLQVFSATEIRCLTPAHPAGTAVVEVRNRYSYPWSSATGFYFRKNPPVVGTISPAEGPSAGGANVNIQGRGFLRGVTVAFGGSTCAVTSVTNTLVKCTTSAHVPGPVPVSVKNSDSFPFTRANAYTYLSPAPVPTLITPVMGSYLGGTVVTINGSGFLPGVRVNFADSPCASVIASQSTIVCTTTAHAPGAVAVKVSNVNSLPAKLPMAFTYLGNAPTIASVTPGSGPATGGTPLTIRGNGFLPGATIYVGASVCINSQCPSPGELHCTTQSHVPALVDVIISNPGSIAGRLPSSYRYLAPGPVVQSVVPAFGSYQGGTPVTVTGTGFMASAQLSFGGSVCNGVALDSPTHLRCTTSAHAAGLVAISISQAESLSGSGGNFYTYVGAPVINTQTNTSPGLTPTTGLRDTSTRVTITGTNLSPPGQEPAVTMSNQPCAIVSYAKAQIVCNTSINLPTGPHPVVISHVGGSTPAAGPPIFTVTDISFSPTEPLNPRRGLVQGGTVITIKGTGLTDAQGRTEVRLDGILCPLVSAVATQVVCTTPPHALGPVNVVVSQGGLSATVPVPFTYVDCTSAVAVVDAAARANFLGADGARQNGLWSQGANVPKFWNPYYGNGTGINYFNNDASRLNACRMRGYSRVESYTVNSWSSPHNNSEMMWNDALTTYEIVRGSWPGMNTFTNTYVCAGKLNAVCDNPKWIFPRAPAGKWHNVDQLHCPTFCSQIGFTNNPSPEGMRCVAGEQQAASAYPYINYRYGYWRSREIPGRSSSDASSGNFNEECYASGQKHDHDSTDKTVGCWCSR